MLQKLREFVKMIPFATEIYHSTIGKLLINFSIAKLYLYDYFRFIKYCGMNESKVSIMAHIIMACHVLEKGLTMPNMRLGFGKENILALVNYIKRYNSYEKNINNKQVIHAVQVIFDYEKVHKDANYLIDSDIKMAIVETHNLFPNIEFCEQFEITSDEYWSLINSDFNHFAKSRHCIRNFEKPVTIEQIKNAVQIANTAPQACNRQACKVHLISDKEMIRKCLELQCGNRGFGHLTDKLLILTIDLRYSYLTEPLDTRTNAGIYLMNLAYGLHYNKVACCILNWFATPSTDKKLRHLLNLPKEETVVAFLVCGDVPDKFKMCCSLKNDANETLVLH